MYAKKYVKISKELDYLSYLRIILRNNEHISAQKSKTIFLHWES